MVFKIFMSVIFILGALGFLRGIKQLNSRSAKYHVRDSFFSLFMGTFQYSGIGRIVIGLLLMVIAIIVIFHR